MPLLIKIRILFKKLNYEIGTAYNIDKGNFCKTGQDEKTMNQINTAIYLLEKNKDYYAISDYLTYMSDIYIIKTNRIKHYNIVEAETSPIRP
jgi:hypothetical protein